MSQNTRRLVKIPESFDSKFRFIIVAAERAKQLLNGAPPKLEMKAKKPATLAIREVEADQIEWQAIPPEVDEAREEEE